MFKQKVIFAGLTNILIGRTRLPC